MEKKYLGEDDPATIKTKERIEKLNQPIVSNDAHLCLGQFKHNN